MNARAQLRKVLAISAVGGLFSLGPNGCKSSDNQDGSGARGAGTDCSSDKDCRQFDLLCEPTARVCVECLTSNHCGDHEICSGGECLAITPCASSRDCPDDQVCSESLSRCVDCVQDADCADGELCAGEQCHAACTSDKDCRKFDLLCATDAGYCVECTSDTHCPGSQRCSEAFACVGAVSSPSGTGGRAEQPGQGGSSAVTGGAPALEAGAPTTPGGDDGGASGAPGTASGGSAGGGNLGGSSPAGGSTNSGGTSPMAGGRAATGGEGGNGGAPSAEQPFPPVAEACALLLSPACLGCCNEVGVFALDSEDQDATALLVDAFQASSSQAEATFLFTDVEQVGAIYFSLPTEIAISDWHLSASSNSGSLQVAVSRSKGAAGCVYEALGELGANWTKVGCWPELSMLGPWDQIEVRLRSYGPGPANLIVSGIELE